MPLGKVRSSIAGLATCSSLRALTKGRSTKNARKWARLSSTANISRIPLRRMVPPSDRSGSVHMTSGSPAIGTNLWCKAGIRGRLPIRGQTSPSARLGAFATETGTYWTSGAVYSITLT